MTQMRGHGGGNLLVFRCRSYLARWSRRRDCGCRTVLPGPILESPVFPLPELNSSTVPIPLNAFESHRQIIADRIHRDSLLSHGVALTHRDGVVLE